MTHKKILNPGFDGLIQFVSFLKHQGVYYELKHSLSDAISVWFVIVGSRFEVDFFNNYVTYNFYKGNEEVFTDDTQFLQLFEEGWDLKN
jgi:hypothetical protein